MNPLATIAQQVEQLICNQQVEGSIPSCGTKGDQYSGSTRDSKPLGVGSIPTSPANLRVHSSAVERSAVNRLVPGSNPGVPAKYGV